MMFFESARPSGLLVAATDGSSNGGQVGYGWFASPTLFGFGPGPDDTHAELFAVCRLLTHVPADQPLLVLCDNHEVHLRLVEQRPPKPTNTYYDLWVEAMGAVEARPVRFERIIAGHRTHPLHAVAHYLAFLGRQGHLPTSGETAPGADRILAAADPDAEAHAMVQEYLFPPAGRGVALG